MLRPIDHLREFANSIESAGEPVLDAHFQEQNVPLEGRCSTWRATPTRGLRGSTTGGGGRSPETSLNQFRSDATHAPKWLEARSTPFPAAGRKLDDFVPDNPKGPDRPAVHQGATQDEPSSRPTAPARDRRLTSRSPPAPADGKRYPGSRPCPREFRALARSGMRRTSPLHRGDRGTRLPRPAADLLSQGRVEPDRHGHRHPPAGPHRRGRRTSPSVPMPTSPASGWWGFSLGGGIAISYIASSPAGTVKAFADFYGLAPLGTPIAPGSPRVPGSPSSRRPSSSTTKRIRSSAWPRIQSPSPMHSRSRGSSTTPSVRTPGTRTTGIKGPSTPSAPGATPTKTRVTRTKTWLTRHMPTP